MVWWVQGPVRLQGTEVDAGGDARTGLPLHWQDWQLKAKLGCQIRVICAAISPSYLRVYRPLFNQKR